MRTPVGIWVQALAATALIGALGCGSKDAAPAATPAPAVEKPVAVSAMPVYEPEALVDKIKKSSAKTTLVALWATWCAPCIAEMPQLDKFAKAHADKGLEVLGVCVDDKEELGEKIQGILDERKVSYPQALLRPGSEEALMKLVGEEWDGMLPKTILLDAKANKLLLVAEALTEEILNTKVLPVIGK